MTDEEALEHAVERAETEVASLEAELQARTDRSRALSQQELAALARRRTQQSEESLTLAEERLAIDREKARLRRALKRPPFRWSSLVASPLTWFFRGAAFTAYVCSVAAAHRLVQSPGLVVALVVGLPVAFLLVSVAGSLRESGAADKIGNGAEQGEGAERAPAVDERGLTAAGGPRGDRSAGVGGSRPRTGAGRDP